MLTQAPAAHDVPGGYSPLTARLLRGMKVRVNRPATNEQQTLVGINRSAGSGRFWYSQAKRPVSCLGTECPQTGADWVSASCVVGPPIIAVVTVSVSAWTCP
jgi:hypothetical protein